MPDQEAKEDSEHWEIRSASFHGEDGSLVTLVSCQADVTAQGQEIIAGSFKCSVSQMLCPS